MNIDEMQSKGHELIKTDPKKIEKELFQVVLEATKRQIEKCVHYRQICKQKNFDPRRDLKSVADFKYIPYITTANFKQKKGRPKDLLLVPESEIRTWFMSSGTSGDPSMVGRDYKTKVRYAKSFDFVIDEILNMHKVDWALLFIPPPATHHTIEDKEVYQIRSMLWFIEVWKKVPDEKKIYALKVGTDADKKAGKPFVPDIEGLLNFLRSKPNEKGVGLILAPAPIVYGLFTQIFSKTGETFNVGEKTILFTGGGWKSMSGQEIAPEQFRALASKLFTIPEANVRDMYVFSETDQMFGECEYHYKHIPPWADVIVRDFTTLEPVKVGEKGLMNVINPMAHSYAGVSILQDDVIRIVKEDGCQCGRRGKIIEMFGRAAGAEAKGCGAQLADETKI